VLERYTQKKQIYLVTQFNHPNELTTQAHAAIRALLRCGIVVKNQTVLLRGVNDSPEVLGALLKKLTAFGVVPYYVFQCRPVTGVKNQLPGALPRGMRHCGRGKGHAERAGQMF